MIFLKSVSSHKLVQQLYYGTFSFSKLDPSYLQAIISSHTFLSETSDQLSL